MAIGAEIVGVDEREGSICRDLPTMCFGCKGQGRFFHQEGNKVLDVLGKGVREVQWLLKLSGPRAQVVVRS